MSTEVYPDLAAERESLLDVLQRTADMHGLDYGDVALDVGGRAGVYVPVIGALGVGRTIIVDPAVACVDEAVRDGLVGDEDAYRMTLEKYVETGHQQGDTSFVFNIRPWLANSTDFMGALTQSVRPGGVIVASMMEASTALSFRTTMGRFYRGDVQRLEVARSRLFIPDNHPNAYVQFWHRTDN
jgi:hypothetical protein